MFEFEDHFGRQNYSRHPRISYQCSSRTLSCQRDVCFEALKSCDFWVASLLVLPYWNTNFFCVHSLVFVPFIFSFVFASFFLPFCIIRFFFFSLFISFWRFFVFLFSYLFLPFLSAYVASFISFPHFYFLLILLRFSVSLLLPFVSFCMFCLHFFFQLLFPSGSSSCLLSYLSLPFRFLPLRLPESKFLVPFMILKQGSTG